MCIEALDQLAHAACLFEARHTCRLRKGLRGCYREQRSGSSRYIYPFTTRFDDTLQFTLFLRAQGTQRMFLRVSHGRFPSFSPSFYHLRFPTDMQSLADPLVGHTAIALEKEVPLTTVAQNQPDGVDVPD